MHNLMGLVMGFIATLDQDERGLNTAELMGNAALAIGALVVIWAALQALGIDVVNWIRGQLLGA